MNQKGVSNEHQFELCVETKRDEKLKRITCEITCLSFRYVIPSLEIKHKQRLVRFRFWARIS